MHRRDALKFFTGSALSGLLNYPIFAQDKEKPAATGFEAAKIVISKLRDGVHLLMGPGGNIAFAAGEQGVLIVDCGIPGRTDDIKAAIAAITPAPIRFLVNTHWHYDHAGGNEALAKSGATIYAHENTRSRMSVDHTIELFKMKMPASPKPAWPTVTFKDSLTLFQGSDELHIDYSPPAHTDTDVFVHFRKANVLHMGDLYFNGTYPFIDFTTGGRLEGMIHSAERALKMVDKDTKIIPGHGPVSGIPELKEYLELLINLRDSVKPLVDAGKTVKEVVAAKPTAKFEAKYGKGFLSGDLFVEVLYWSLAPKSEKPVGK